MNHTETRINVPAMPQDPQDQPSEVVRCGLEDLLSTNVLPDTWQILQFVDTSARSDMEEDSSAEPQGAQDDVVGCGVDDLLPGKQVPDTSQMLQFADTSARSDMQEDSSAEPQGAQDDVVGCGGDDLLAGKHVADTSQMLQFAGTGSATASYENSLGDLQDPWVVQAEWSDVGVDDLLPWTGLPEGPEPARCAQAGDDLPQDDEHFLVYSSSDMPSEAPCMADFLTALVNVVNSFPHTLSLLLVGVAYMTMTLSPENE